MAGVSVAARDASATTGGTPRWGRPDAAFRSVSIDSRRVKLRALFAPWPLSGPTVPATSGSGTNGIFIRPTVICIQGQITRNTTPSSLFPWIPLGTFRVPRPSEVSLRIQAGDDSRYPALCSPNIGLLLDGSTF